VLTSWSSVPIGNREMQAYIAHPESTGPFPAVIVGMYGFGVDEFIQGICDHLAEEGYFAIAPDLYHRDTNEDLILIRTMSIDDPRRIPMILTKIGRLRDDAIIEDMRALTAYMGQLGNIDEHSVGITGFCIGGRIAYMFAALCPMFRVVGLFYSFGMEDSWGPGPSPLSLTPDIKCPVIGFFGAEDTNPTREDVEKLSRELNSFLKAHQFHTYESVGHAFMESTNDRKFDPTAAKDAWEKLLDCFDTEMKTG
jgi:carboxymethylenebutenolidase